ncbi:MAG: cytidylate kinase-like family protein [Chlorobi bacterium]|nr:cytidylate kinase-like family protein [Chlorobiota bacterium]
MKKTLTPLEKVRLYIETHTKISEEAKLKMRKLNPGPAITISRETGIGAEVICEKLIQYFKTHVKDKSIEWAYFDKNLIKKVLEDNNLPDRLNKFMTEEKTSTMDSMLNELIGIHPSRLKLFHKISKTIYQLAELGNVIIVGRGGNIITANLSNAYHIRLVAPLKVRVETAQKLYGYDKKTTYNFIKKEDKARRDHIKKYYHKDIDDPLLYHLTINTNLLSFDDIAEIIGQLVIRRFPEMFET